MRFSLIFSSFASLALLCCMISRIEASASSAASNITADNLDLDDEDDEIVLTETQQERAQNEQKQKELMEQKKKIAEKHHNDGGGCGGPSWYSFQDKCYFVHQDMAGTTFHDAVMICEKYRQARLLTVHSKEESDYLNSLLFDRLKLKYSVWLGLVRVNDTALEWLDTRQLSSDNFTNWAPNEPNNFGSKHYCVVISSNQDMNKGQWYDVSCNELFLVVCQRSKTPETKVDGSMITMDQDQRAIFDLWAASNDPQHHPTSSNILDPQSSNNHQTLIFISIFNLVVLSSIMILIAVWLLYLNQPGFCRLSQPYRSVYPRNPRGFSTSFMDWTTNWRTKLEQPANNGGFIAETGENGGQSLPPTTTLHSKTVTMDNPCFITSNV